MKRLCIPLVICCSGILSGTTLAQSADTAAERAKLADQRIRIEADRRAQEALESRQPTASEAQQTNDSKIQVTAGTTQSHEDPAAAAAPDADSGDARSAVDDTGISEALDQLRELGELRDAGYVTEEEFERIKKRILDSRF